ncbi:cytochrome P450 [Chlorella sorokiniana]|uniref:Cytochrome P450 n=1 Tax=Chlorella sorokiniana TaxID=3076 RepID=A0A2P6TNL8_CHLSO|nr:cytochrome P450 [Chlorella sorokiniana]|eukprot:PRW50922.1 cytochrome P450 [Chlorella sorokiniana]
MPAEDAGELLLAKRFLASVALGPATARPLCWALVLMTLAAAAAGRGVPQALSSGPPGSLRRLRQTQEAGDSRSHEDGLPRLGSMPDVPELAAAADQLPVWLSPGFTMPLPPDAVVKSSRGPRPLVMCLFGLAFLGVAAAAWVGLRAWRRNYQRQRQRQQHRHDLESLLWARQQQQQLGLSDGYQPVEAAEPELGCGPHGETYRGRLNGQGVVIKVVEPQPGFDAAALQPWVQALQAAPHPHVLAPTAAAAKGGLLLLVSELVGGHCLHAALQHQERRRQLAWTARGREVALAVAGALSHLHVTLRMAHGNLTASNLLLGDSGSILVTDAGLSALLSSPPAAHGVHAALADDVHSLGELLAAMLAPQPGEAPSCPEAVANMIQACRLPDPQQRPTAAHRISWDCNQWLGGAQRRHMGLWAVLHRSNSQPLYGRQPGVERAPSEP